MRPLVLVAAPVTGLRRAFILGAVLNALSCPALAFIDGVGLALAMYALTSALGQVFYYTCYHALFSTLGDADRMGSQVGGCQTVSALAALFGPGIGGILLTRFGPWAAFGTAFLVTLVAILPILRVDEPLVTRIAPVGAYAAAKNAARLYFADGWIQVSLTTAWSIVTFRALGGRYDSFGATMSLAGLVGAIGGMVLGRLIDKGNARSAVWMNAATLTVGLLLRSVTFGHAAAVVAVAVSTAMLSGLYLPSWMTPVYNQAKVSPCMLRFQFAAEAGWDIGGALAGSIAAAICFFQLPVEAAILLALPIIRARSPRGSCGSTPTRSARGACSAPTSARATRRVRSPAGGCSCSAPAEVWGLRGGGEWMVSHHLLAPRHRHLTDAAGLRGVPCRARGILDPGRERWHGSTDRRSW